MRLSRSYRLTLGVLILLVAVLVALMAAFAATATAAGAEPTLTATERQLTFNAGDEYDSAISGDLVVYTANRLNNTDVYYVNIADGIEHPVTAAAGAQELSDVSGRLITYTDLNANDVFVYSTLSGEATNITASPGAYSSNPSISDQLVAWEDTRDGNVEIYAMDLATGIERRVTDSVAMDSTPQAHDSRIVWQVCDAGICDIALYDWDTGLTEMVTKTTGRDERRPDVDGDWVVYDGYRDGERDIYAYNLQTHEEQRLWLAGSQNNPNVSGGVVSFEDVSTGVYHIMLWDLASGASFQLTSGAGGEYLNDIDGNRVVYTAQRDSQLDIYLSEFTITGGDTTAPTITLNAPVGGRTYPLGSELQASYSCADEPGGSGLVSCQGSVGGEAVADGALLDTSTVGPRSLTVTAEDEAGNVGTQTVTYSVIYDVQGNGGFSIPLNDNRTLAGVRAGAVVPIKFSLGGYFGDVLAQGYPLSIQIPCEAGDPVVPVETPAEFAGGSGLHYDAAADQYGYNWKTDRAWAGTCRLLDIKFADGSTHAFRFVFR